MVATAEKKKKVKKSEQQNMKTVEFKRTPYDQLKPGVREIVDLIKMATTCLAEDKVTEQERREFLDNVQEGLLWFYTTIVFNYEKHKGKLAQL